MTDYKEYQAALDDYLEDEFVSARNVLSKYVDLLDQLKYAEKTLADIREYIENDVRNGDSLTAYDILQKIKTYEQ